jgi:hypothetical protein
MNRAQFIKTLALGGAGVVLSPLAQAHASLFARRRADFLFTRLQYLSGDWDYDFRNKRWLEEDNTNFGVNIVMYAMTA